MKRASLIMHILAVGVATVVLCSPAVRAQGGQLKPVDDPEAYSVYAGLLQTGWNVRFARVKTLVFQQETGTRWECVPSGKPLEAEWKPVMESFRKENAGIRLLQTGFSLGIPYVVVPTADLQASIHGVPTSPWSGFYERYPDSGGFIVASAVGFDALKQRAIFYMGYSCGPLCGGGSYHFLEKVDGAWREANIMGLLNCFWVS
jgi:hypothetical protein